MGKLISAHVVCIGDTTFTFGNVFVRLMLIVSISVTERLDGRGVNFDIACFAYIIVSSGTSVIR